MAIPDSNTKQNAEWDRATRSMWDGLQIIKAVIDAGAAIKVLDRSYIERVARPGPDLRREQKYDFEAGMMTAVHLSKSDRIAG